MTVRTDEFLFDHKSISKPNISFVQRIFYSSLRANRCGLLPGSDSFAESSMPDEVANWILKRCSHIYCLSLLRLKWICGLCRII